VREGVCALNPPPSQPHTHTHTHTHLRTRPSSHETRAGCPRGRCCFDYGNAEAKAHDSGDGTMEAIYFGNDEAWWRERPANKTGPWIMADIENGMCVKLNRAA
jgi:hypothetical protein